MGRRVSLGTWSSGMIPASGAGGPGFNSRSTPYFWDIYAIATYQLNYKYKYISHRLMSKGTTQTIKERLWP